MLMRSAILALPVVLTVGAFGATGASAAPVSGQAIIDASQQNVITEDVQWRRCWHRRWSGVRCWGGGGHWWRWSRRRW
jgi:hypothetical protein